MMQGAVFASQALCAEITSPRVEQQNMMPSHASLMGSTFLERSCDRRRRCDAVREFPHECEQALRLLDLRDVASFWDELEASVGQRLGIGTAIIRIHNAITLAPDNECRNLHATKSAAQLRIVHPRLSPVNPKRLEVRCHRCDLVRAKGGGVDAEGRRVVVAQR